MKETFNPKVAQNQRTYRKRQQGNGRVRGERVGNSVLNEEIVRTIRAMRSGFGWGSKRIQRALASDGLVFKPSTIESVLAYRNWVWVK